MSLDPDLTVSLLLSQKNIYTTDVRIAPSCRCSLEELRVLCTMMMLDWCKKTLPRSTYIRVWAREQALWDCDSSDPDSWKKLAEYTSAGGIEIVYNSSVLRHQISRAAGDLVVGPYPDEYNKHDHLIARFRDGSLLSDPPVVFGAC